MRGQVVTVLSKKAATFQNVQPANPGVSGGLGRRAGFPLEAYGGARGSGSKQMWVRRDKRNVHVRPWTPCVVAGQAGRAAGVCVVLVRLLQNESELLPVPPPPPCPPPVAEALSSHDGAAFQERADSESPAPPDRVPR